MTKQVILSKIGADTLVSTVLYASYTEVLNPLLIGLGVAFGNALLIIINIMIKKLKKELHKKAERLKEHTPDIIDDLIDTLLLNKNQKIDEIEKDLKDKITKKIGEIKNGKL